MKKFIFWNLSAILLSLTLIVESPVVYASQGKTIDARVEARYSSNRISWKSIGNHLKYNVYRVGDDETKLSFLKTVDGLEFIDNDSGVNTQESYVIKCTADESIKSPIVRDSYRTGIEAVQGHAAEEINNFHVSLLGGNEKFNGSKVLSFSKNIHNLQELRQGTVLISFKTEKDKKLNNREVLLNIKDKNVQTATDNYMTGAPNPANCISFMQGDSDVIRYDFGNNTVRYNISDAIGDIGWTTYSLTTYTDGKISYFKNRVNGKNGDNYDHQGNYLHDFLNNSAITSLDSLTIGGAINNGINKAGFKGEIAYVTITDEVMSEEEVGEYSVAVSNKLNRMGISLGSEISGMFNDDIDNTWLFVGGEEVQGGYEHVQGMRNYVSHFEEYIRWTQSSNTLAGKQRFVINAGKKGQSLNDIVENFSSYEKEYNPKAMAYMVGKEDYVKNSVVVFKEELRKFINLSLSLRSDKGFAIIQKPHITNESDTDNIVEKYCEAVDEVVEEFTKARNDQRIIVVEYNIKNESLKDGFLNKKGHYEIAKQLSEATIKTISNFPCTIGVNFNLENINTVETYAKDVKPSIMNNDNSLEIEIPPYGGVQEWVYDLVLNDKTITDVVSNKFVISQLEKDAEYSLKIQSKDGKIQIRTMSGKVGDNNSISVKAQPLNHLQEQIKDKLSDEDSLTWLFMGDSITHGAAYTLGQDSVAQSFEKYLKDDLNRVNDIVINTGVSGATIDTFGNSTLASINERLNEYNPDIVSIMLGTNDSVSLTPEQYRSKLQMLVDKAKAKTDIVVLRSPLPTQWDRDAMCKEYTLIMEEVANDENCVFVDQYTPFHNIVNKYPYMYQDQYYIYGDSCVFGQGRALHPGANGHLMMTRQFIEGIGILDEDTFIPNQFIKVPFQDKEDTTTTLFFDKTKNSISFNTKQLSGLKDVRLIAKVGTKVYEVSGESDVLTLDHLPSNQNYEVTVSGYSTSKPQLISYASQNVELVDKTKLSDLIDKCDEKDLSVYTINSKKMFEEALEVAKNINMNLNSTIKEIDDAIGLLNEAIERLTIATTVEIDAGDDIFIDDIKLFESSIKKNSEVKKIIEEASQQGKSIMLKVSLVKKDEEGDTTKNFINENERAFGCYHLQSSLIIDGQEICELKDINCPVRVEIGIPKKLLNDGKKSFYFIGSTHRGYQKIDFIRTENSITFSGHIGSNYSFVEEVKPNILIKNEELRPSISALDKINLDKYKNRRNNGALRTVQTGDRYQPQVLMIMFVISFTTLFVQKMKRK